MFDLNEIAHVCVCGSKLWNVRVMFEDFEIAAYMLDMSCAMCDSTAIAPTLVDKPDENLVTV